jgi:hypothetical protein
MTTAGTAQNVQFGRVHAAGLPRGPARRIFPGWFGECPGGARNRASPAAARAAHGLGGEHAGTVTGS